jgi:hypothetical protein
VVVEGEEGPQEGEEEGAAQEAEQPPVAEEEEEEQERLPVEQPPSQQRKGKPGASTLSCRRMRGAWLPEGTHASTAEHTLAHAEHTLAHAETALRLQPASAGNAGWPLFPPLPSSPA